MGVNFSYSVMGGGGGIFFPCILEVGEGGFIFRLSILQNHPHPRP